MNMRRQFRNAIKRIIKPREGEVQNNEETLLSGAKVLAQVEKTVIVKINVDREGNYFLDNNGKEVEMLDATENYIKKVTTEAKKVQGILSYYMRGN